MPQGKVTLPHVGAVYWEDPSTKKSLDKESEGIPFVIMDQKIYDCHHGKDGHSAEKEKLNKKRHDKVSYTVY